MKSFRKIGPIWHVWQDVFRNDAIEETATLRLDTAQDGAVVRLPRSSDSGKGVIWHGLLLWIGDFWITPLSDRGNTGFIGTKRKLKYAF